MSSSSIGLSAIPNPPTPPASSSRGLPSNPAPTVRRMPVPIPDLSDMPPPPPIPEKFQNEANSTKAASTKANSTMSAASALSVSAPLSASQVISLAREAMSSALHDNEAKAAEASGVSNDMKPGVTIDLSRNNIQELPDEVVDIIKNELERLALSHNMISTFPARFSECTSLRYLNVRNNHITEFPLPLCDLTALEILDLGRNKIRVLPPEIAKLASLKVLSVQKNRIQELPLCLADMVSLQVLKLDGNKITFPPREILEAQASSPPHEGYLSQTEVTEVTVTAHIKKFLKQKLMEKADAEKAAADVQHVGEDAGETFETPRVQIKRVASGRFPIRVNGVDAPDPRSPNMSRAPPIPSRSHARGLSQQNGPMRRPGVMPLTMGNPNERFRSNSESWSQASRGNGPFDRQRRMGMMSKRANELGTLDETQANNRFSAHLRGLSHGSSLNPNPDANMATGFNQNSPVEPLLHRPDYVRRLSVLPEQRRESKVFDPIVESAKGILYSIFQIHPMIQLFTRLTNDGTAKRSSLEIVFYNTNVHVEELEQEIQKHDTFMNQTGSPPRENENVQRAVMTLINAYSHICALLVQNMETIVENGDPRYLRTLITLLYNSVMELRVTANEAAVGFAGTRKGMGNKKYLVGGTLKPHSREPSATTSLDRPPWGTRSRNASFAHAPNNLRVATEYVGANGRTTPATLATPRSGESFASPGTDPSSAIDISAEERMFEKIFLSLSKLSDMVMRTLPHFSTQFNGGLRNARTHRAPEHVLQTWKALIARCTYVVQQTDLLKGRLSSIKLMDPGVRTDMVFWSLCKSFIDAWAEFGNMLRYSMDHVHLPMDIRPRLRPLQLRFKETTQLIMSSPWESIFRQAGRPSDNTNGSNYYTPGHYASNSSINQMQLPMTPQSAALGPAVQATVPSTPQNASFAHAFNGNVFERADTLINMGGLSMSRTGTMSSASGASLNSISSLASTHDDQQRYGLSSTGHSPSGGVPGPATFRRNGGGKPAF